MLETVDSKFAKDSIISGNFTVNNSSKSINFKFAQAPKISLFYEIGRKGAKRTPVGLHFDLNFNGTKDAGDPLITSFSVGNKALNRIISKDQFKGGFKANLNTGTYALSFANGNNFAKGKIEPDSLLDALLEEIAVI